MDLSDLLGHCTPEEFLRNYWEQRPLFVGNSETSEELRTLLNPNDVDRLLTTSELRYPAFRLAKLGQDIPLSQYTRDIRRLDGPNITGLVDVDSVISHFQEGATLILQGLHRSWEPLATLCRSLERTLNYPTQTNLYFTPPNAQGFAKHWDTHDVFVIQLTGHKQWLVYGSPTPLPMDNQRYSETGDILEPLLTRTLVPGDVLYIPRGFVHEGKTSASASLHVTLGVLSYTWRDLLHILIDVCAQHDIALRRGIPPADRLSEQATKNIADTLKDLVTNFSSTHLRLAVAKLDDQLVSTRRPILRGHLLDYGKLSTIDPDTRVIRRPHVLFRLENTASGPVLVFHRKKLIFPARVAAAVAHIVTVDSLTPRQLPNCVDDPGKVVLIRRLVKEGFLMTETS